MKRISRFFIVRPKPNRKHFFAIIRPSFAKASLNAHLADRPFRGCTAKRFRRQCFRAINTAAAIALRSGLELLRLARVPRPQPGMPFSFNVASALYNVTDGGALLMGTDVATIRAMVSADLASRVHI
jgi:hypothetical protein